LFALVESEESLDPESRANEALVSFLVEEALKIGLPARAVDALLLIVVIIFTSRSSGTRLSSSWGRLTGLSLLLGRLWLTVCLLLGSGLARLSRLRIYGWDSVNGLNLLLGSHLDRHRSASVRRYEHNNKQRH
jgi:hypothetical protein